MHGISFILLSDDVADTEEWGPVLQNADHISESKVTATKSSQEGSKDVWLKTTSSRSYWALACSQLDMQDAVTISQNDITNLQADITSLRRVVRWRPTVALSTIWTVCCFHFVDPNLGGSTGGLLCSDMDDATDDKAEYLQLTTHTSQLIALWKAYFPLVILKM